MTRPISARTRADAIAICEQRHADPMAPSMLVMDTAEEIGASKTARHLAFAAWNAAIETGVLHRSTFWLEASGLLRDGWCPGDPVEVRQ